MVPQFMQRIGLNNHEVKQGIESNIPNQMIGRIKNNVLINS